MKDIFEIVYLISEEGVNTQRALGERMHLSLGKVNTLVSECIKRQYIVYESDYSVTEKGKKLLSDNKVDNAIIMAAGFGSRFVPMTYDTPKGLLEVYGEVMIERQIKQLHEVGIKDITIVVGYLKEKFEYLIDKFGVKLIYNPDYSIKNNISSIYYAKNELKNTYILTSDIYMPNNLYRKYEYQSFYGVEFFQKETDEWAVSLNKDNLIIDVDPKGGNETWALFGPAFFNKEYSEKIISIIGRIYHKTNVSQWYWEDVFRNYMVELPMYARKYEHESILEFESLEELREYDDSYFVNSRSEILDVIKTVFDIELSDIKGIKTLKEGMTNDSFLFEVNGEQFVFRNPGVGTEMLINRYQEQEVYQAIEKLNISDDIIYLQPDKGFKISRFIPNSRVIDPRDNSEVKLAMEKIKFLHNSNLKVDHSFDIEERIEFYYGLCKKNNAILFRDFNEIYENIKDVLKFLKSSTRPQCLCHIDSVYTNFLLADGRMILLDWEYSGMADPLIDIAMYVVFAGYQDMEILDLLKMYLERDYTSEELIIVHSYVALSGFLWSLWTQYKQSSGEDFGTYGMEQYQYARKYSRIVLKELNNHA